YFSPMETLQKNASTSVQFGEYKGHKTITLNPEARYPFTFGLAKALLIVQNIEAIQKFVASEVMEEK
ncbi:MAG: hypothetical protein EBV23_12325, partial [Flavobacteriia bacterium]|nr:hypothetical protein [Flavobacteriia bacterium]